MCNANCITFGQKHLTPDEIRGKRVIEIGSYDFNGSLRSVVEPMKPASYTGVDIVRGRGVDMICSAENLLECFGEAAFDIVISTELIEHVLDWRRVISNIKHLCTPGGLVLLTTRSKGFEYHGWPYDFWRYEPQDMERIFSDFTIAKIETDDLGPGVFVKARKPLDFCESDLSGHALYSIVEDRRTASIDEEAVAEFTRKHADEYRTLERQTVQARVVKLMRDMRWRLNRLVR